MLNQTMNKGFLSLPWFLWAALALLVAIVYAFVWPQNATVTTAGLRFFIVRWGHALTWLLLAINSILRGISPSLNSAANWIALAGGLIYLLFLVRTFMVK